MKKNMKYTIIIPSLNPNNKLLELVCELIDNGFKDIIVINDGSSSEYDNIFEELPKSIKLIKNEINLGKGASIKKAISCIKNSDAFITVDSDGQHLVKDVIKIKEELNNNDIVLGVRNFNNKNVPIKSKIGNKISSFVFKIKTGIKLNDTQTGLRGINIKYKDLLLSTKGDRYEYEMNFLYNVAKSNIQIHTIPISTVYNKDNISHFNVIRDSILIHKWIIFILIIILLILLIIFMPMI